MQIQRKRFLRNASIVLAMISALVGAGCVSHPLVPDATRGKTFAVYPASIALTVKTKNDEVKDFLISLAKTMATAGYVLFTPGPGQNVSSGDLGSALMNELAIRFEREFGVSKVADLKPLSSSKSTGGQLTEAEVKSDYQNVADYLVQFDSVPSTLSFEGSSGNYIPSVTTLLSTLMSTLTFEGSSDNYTFRYFVSANVYDAKTGQRLDWAGCSGAHGAAPLADWFKDNGKMLDVGTQEVASKCADEMIRKLNK